MKTLKKTDLLSENKRLSAALDVHEAYLMHAFRGEVTFVSKGNVRIGYCGETRAHGGIVLEAMRGDGGQWYVFGVHYFEAWYEGIRNYPVRDDDKERIDLRICATQAASQIAEKQAAFFAPKVAQEMAVAS